MEMYIGPEKNCHNLHTLKISNMFEQGGRFIRWTLRILVCCLCALNGSASNIGVSGLRVYCSNTGSLYPETSDSVLSALPNPWSFLYFANEGLFRINMTALNSAGYSYADIQLIKRVPWYYTYARDGLDAGAISALTVPLLSAASPILELFYGPADISGLGAPGLDTDRFRDRVENGLVLDKLTAIYGSAYGELSEWTRLPPPCTSRTVQLTSDDSHTECLVHTNPLAEVCIVVQSNRRVIRDTAAGVDQAEGKNSDGDSGAEQPSAVVYTLELPLLSSAWVWGLGAEIYHEVELQAGAIKAAVVDAETEEEAGGNGLNMGLGYVYVALSFAVDLIDMVGIRDNLIDPLISLAGQLPLAVVCLAAGVFTFTNVEELVSNVWMQYIIMITGGLAMSMLTFVIMLFSFFKNLLPQVPFANSLFGLLLLFPAALLGNSTTLYFIKRFFSEYVLIFWREGVFGISWIGKVYVGVYVLGCMAMSKYFRVFGHDTYSRWCIIQSLQACAVVLVLHGSTSAEITWPLVALLYSYDYLASNLPSWYVHVAGYMTPSSTRYSGRIITTDQYEAEGKYYTEKALKELQQQLAEDQRGTDRVSDTLYRDGKHLQASMIKRFANGDYSGLPETNTRKFNSYYSQLKYFIIPKYAVYTLLVLCIAGVGVYFYLSSTGVLG